MVLYTLCRYGKSTARMSKEFSTRLAPSRLARAYRTPRTPSHLTLSSQATLLYLERIILGDPSEDVSLSKGFPLLCF